MQLSRVCFSTVLVPVPAISWRAESTVLLCRYDEADVPRGTPDVRERRNAGGVHNQ